MEDDRLVDEGPRCGVDDCREMGPCDRLRTGVCGDVKV